VRILVADDHAVVRSGLKAILGARPGWEVCAEATNGNEAVSFAGQCRPDVAIVDLNMPGLSGLEAIARIKKNVPKTEVVVLTCHYSKPLLRAVLDSGAVGFVLKSDADRDLINATEAAFQGNFFISRQAETGAVPVGPHMFATALAERDALTTDEWSQVRLISKRLRQIL
jgi:DNA-binding NarL/FixJ family response regulator